MTRPERIRSRAEARGSLVVAASFAMGAGGMTHRAILELARVLQYVLDQMDKNHPEVGPDD